MGIPLRPEASVAASPSLHDIQDEFGTQVFAAGEMFLNGKWWAKVPGTDLWACGADENELRGQLARHARLNGHA